MNMTYKSRFSTGSSENVLKSSVNDEFKQRSFQNSQILNQYKRKEISKKSNENQNSQTKKSLFTSGSSTNKYSTRAPLKKISVFDFNASSNNIDSVSKSQDPFTLSYFKPNDSDNDDLILQQDDQNDLKQKTKIQISKAPHVSFSGKVKTSQSANISISSDNIDNSSISYSKKGKDIVEANKIKNGDIEDTIVDLEKKNLVLMKDLRENCQLLNSIQKRLDQSTKDIITKSNEIVSLKKQIAELKGKTDDSNQIAKNDTNENSKETENSNEQIKELNDKISQIQQQNEELIKKNEDLTKKNEELTKKNEEFTKRKEELETNQEKFIKEKDSQNQIIEQLKSEINKLKSQNEEFQLQQTESNHNQELNSLISDLKQKNIEIENQLKQQQQENQSLKQLKAENEKVQQNIIEIQKENDKLKQEIARIQKENEVLNENQVNLLNQNEKFRKSNETIEPNHNNNDKSQYQIYDAYSDLSENESEENHSIQEIVHDDKSTPSKKENSSKKQQLQQQCFFDDFESQSYASDFSSEFSFTDGSDRNEIMNSPKASIIQQLIAANQKNKSLREANAKLESVASTVMSDYTEALNKIKVLEKKKKLSVEFLQNNIFESEEVINNDENKVLQQKLNEMETKLQKLNNSYSQLRNSHLETFSNFIQKRQEFFKKEMEELNSFNASQQSNYNQIQSQLDSFLS